MMCSANRDASRSDPVDATAAQQLDPENVELKQLGCCYNAQADGIPCTSPECTCDTCERSQLCIQVRR